MAVRFVICVQFTNPQGPQWLMLVAAKKNLPTYRVTSLPSYLPISTGLMVETQKLVWFQAEVRNRINNSSDFMRRLLGFEKWNAVKILWIEFQDYATSSPPLRPFAPGGGWRSLGAHPSPPAPYRGQPQECEPLSGSCKVLTRRSASVYTHVALLLQLHLLFLPFSFIWTLWFFFLALSSSCWDHPLPFSLLFFLSVEGPAQWVCMPCVTVMCCHRIAPVEH